VEPLVLIHGGLTMIGEIQGWVQPLAKTHAKSPAPMSFGGLRRLNLGHASARDLPASVRKLKFRRI
jgi:hypothetical protein